MTSIPPSSTLLAEWEALQAAAPSTKGPPSDEQELALRRRHKARVEEFRQRLSPEEWAALAALTKKPAKKKKKKEKKKKLPQKKALPPLLSPKNKSVTLGWTTNHEYTFSQLLPFYSHTKRSKTEEYEDQEVFQGIDRRCFSNLYEEEEMEVPPLVVTDGVNLMRHDFLNTTGKSSEHFYQAAKCVHEFDARFIMTELNSLEAAKYGQSRLVLTQKQRDALIAAGADPQDFLQETKGWLRGKDGLLPRRSDWESVTHVVMLHILRSKFCGTRVSPTVTKSVEAIMLLPSIPLFVEHTPNDSIWGDHGDGTGSNLLGKTLSQVFLEIAAEVSPAPVTVDIEALKVPNNEIVDYATVSNDDERPSQESVLQQSGM